MTAKIRKDGEGATTPILCDWRAFGKNIWTFPGGG
jgi:hypothetical protein